MSWYALHQIYLMRDDQPLVQMASLYPTIESYIKSSTDERMDLRGIPVSAFVKTNLAYLQKECYNRAANAAVAYAILPLLHQHPELWKIVPYMDRLNTDMDFRTALDTLLGLASISGSGANEFIQMLCQ